MNFVWTKVEDGLPEKAGWYLTYSPDYWRGNAFGNRENCQGLVFCKFMVSKDGKSRWWSVEGKPEPGRKWMNSGVVKAWAPLPLPDWAEEGK